MIEIQNDFARTLTIAAVCDTVDFCSSDLTCETANRVAKRTLPTHLSHANIRFHLAILLLRSVTWKLWKFLCQNLFRRQAITVNVTKSKDKCPFTPVSLTTRTRSLVVYASADRKMTRPMIHVSFRSFKISDLPLRTIVLLPKNNSSFARLPLGWPCRAWILSKMGCPGGKTCRIELFQVGTTRQQGQSKTSLPRHYRSRVFPKQVARRIIFTKSREFS